MRASSSSAISEGRLARRDALVLAGAALLSVGFYLLLSGFTYRVGFPLDDAWIHQTYARNLALHGEWAFIPGEPSGGSTAPLWSALLAVGFWIKLAPYAWTYLLGAAALWGVAMLGEWTVRRLAPAYRPRFPWAGIALGLEWHLVWAAASGMETLLYALVLTAVFALLLSGYQKYFALGLLTGLSLWLRPDGITLLGPLVIVLLFSQFTWGKCLPKVPALPVRGLANLGMGFVSVFALYLLFNLAFAGSPWPNTFYAKQAEYASYLQLPFLKRLGDEFLLPLVGVGVILLPGAVMTVVSAIRRRAWSVLAVATWFLGYLALYAWQLPVTYQHGRYVIPAMPIFFLLGLAGLLGFSLPKVPLKVPPEVPVPAAAPRSGREPAAVRRERRRCYARAKRPSAAHSVQHGPRCRRSLEGGGWVVPMFWKASAGAVLAVFWIYGGITYARDVAMIESEMVASAKWVARNVQPDALVAAHDIGALGYFGEHDLLDLAGLVSPEVIPFIRDEQKIATYLDEQDADYLVVFPDWYSSLTSNLEPIFTTGAPYAPALGERNMAVYEWPGQ